MLGHSRCPRLSPLNAHAGTVQAMRICVGCAHGPSAADEGGRCGGPQHRPGHSTGHHVSLGVTNASLLRWALSNTPSRIQKSAPPTPQAVHSPAPVVCQSNSMRCAADQAPWGYGSRCKGGRIRSSKPVRRASRQQITWMLHKTAAILTALAASTEGWWQHRSKTDCSNRASRKAASIGSAGASPWQTPAGHLHLWRSRCHARRPNRSS